MYRATLAGASATRTKSVHLLPRQRSTWNPVTLLALSIHVSATCRDDNAVATSSDGPDGGTGSDDPLIIVKWSRTEPTESRNLASSCRPFTSRTTEPRVSNETNIAG